MRILNKDTLLSHSNKALRSDALDIIESELQPATHIRTHGSIFNMKVESLLLEGSSLRQTVTLIRARQIMT